MADRQGDQRSSKPYYPGLEELGAFIRTQRKMLDISQRELARLTQLSDPYVSQLERGKHEPSVRVLKALAGALNVRAETLLAYAGLLDPDQATTTVIEAVQADPHLTDDQKTTLIGVYRNFRGVDAATTASDTADSGGGAAGERGDS